MQAYSPPGRSTRECKYWWFDGWDWIVNRAISVAGAPHILAGPGEIAVDLHMHTLFSHCSISQPDAILRRAARIGLSGVAITDHHGEMRGAHDAARCAEYLKERGALPESFLVIPGTEVNSTVGHIVALFINARIPEHLTPEETVRMIHEAGGLAVGAHPYHSTGIEDALFDAPFDAVEVECGSVFDSRLVARNRELVSDPRLSAMTKLGTSDAHYINAIGSCYSVLNVSEASLDAVKEAIRSGRSQARTSEPCRRLRSLLGKISKLK